MRISSQFAKKGLPTALLLGFAIMLAACAPQAAPEGGSSKADGKGGAATVAVEWSPEADCTVCHATEAATRENSACLVSKHASSNCVDCHVTSDALAAEHEGVTAEDRLPKRLTKTDVPQGQCLTCHTSYEALAEKTADYQGLVDSEGTMVNPHALPASADHEDITCTNCHAMHVSDASVEEKSASKCVSCHHADVFTCGTCHN